MRRTEWWLQLKHWRLWCSEIEEISLELVEKIASMRDQSGCAAINKVGWLSFPLVEYIDHQNHHHVHQTQNQDQACQEFALESIGLIFLGSRLGRIHHLHHPPILIIIKMNQIKILIIVGASGVRLLVRASYVSTLSFAADNNFQWRIARRSAD